MTIITPTYNRAYTLRKVYDSLINQTNLDFKWLIIDDGSTDDTEALVSSLKSDSPFDIEYIKKENGGKASAINVALDIIDTPYCTCLDSDDWFPKKTMEIVLRLLKEEIDNAKCCGVIGLKATSDGIPTGSGTIPQRYKYINLQEAYYDLNIRSEFATFYKSEIAKKYRFPIIKGERFMPPSWFHYTVGENYKFRVCWDNLCLFEYMEDGLTKNKKSVIVKNPKSYTLIKSFSLKYSKTFKQKIKNGIMYDCGCIISKNKAWFSDSPRKGITVLCYPLAWGVYLLRFRKKLIPRGIYEEKICKALYVLIAKHLPISNSKLNIGQKKIRYALVKRFISFCGVNVNIEKNARFGDNLNIGDNSGIGINADIRGKVIIGNDVMMGPNCTIYTQNHNFSRTDIPIIQQGMASMKEVRIGDDVWIGGAVTILPGITIGSHSVIGACSVVTHDVPKWAVVAGNPAKVIRFRKEIEVG